MAEDNFRIRKISKRGRISIWIVDGKKVRTELDEEFTNFGQHFKFKCIPVDEFWLDRESSPDERKFFIDHLLVEWRLMQDGKSYGEAIVEADKKEAVERKKSGDWQKILNKSGNIDLNKIHKTVLRKLDNGLTVWLVSGRLVRSIFNIDFTEGGHDIVYKFVPKGEIWIDDDLTEKERPFVFLHEIYEHEQMSKGLTYKQAHKKASRLEWQCRHNEKKLKEELKEWGWS